MIHPLFNNFLKSVITDMWKETNTPKNQPDQKYMSVNEKKIAPKMRYNLGLF